jgi:hypothetical protein
LDDFLYGVARNDMFERLRSAAGEGGQEASRAQLTSAAATDVFLPAGPQQRAAYQDTST